jgi:hypothetical protein
MQASNIKKDACMKNVRKVESKVIGGKARAEALTPEHRKEIARKAATARWGSGVVQATHKGSFKADFGIDIECYVLNDGSKTAVINQRGMGEAIGLGRYGSRLPKFISGNVISQYVGHELKEKLSNPLVFQDLTPGTNTPIQTKLHGYDVTILIDLCKAILHAESDGKLLNSQQKFAKQAQIILNASAKAGIRGLVYALAGYDQTKEDVIAAYKLYVREEAREYEREFAPELYEHWYRLYRLPKPERGRPWEFRYLTIDHIYHPLAKSSGKVFELAKISKSAIGERSNKIHQFLSEIGVKALRTQVGKILGIAMVSDTREEYERHIKEKIYGQTSLPFKG